MQTFLSATCIGVQFPTPLNEAFLAAFPLAKWDSQHGYWQLELSEKLQLDQWRELVQYVATELELAEKLVLIDQRVIDVKKEISVLHERHSATWKKALAASNSKEALESALDALDAAQKERVRVEVLFAVKRHQMEALLGCVVDVDAIRSAADMLIANSDPCNLANLKIVTETQAALILESKKLKKVHLRWEALEKLALTPIKKLDWSDPQFLTEMDWITVISTQ